MPEYKTNTTDAELEPGDESPRHDENSRGTHGGSAAPATEVRCHAEYDALRDTIRQRGTVRMVLAPAMLLAWAGTAVATSAVITVALSTVVPLLVLAAGFEAVLALHMNVERLGRYIQVFHERDHGWEHVAMDLGSSVVATPDPLFSRLFTLAISANFLPAALGGTQTEIAVVAVLHLVVAYRVFMGRRAAATQRATDLDRFRRLRANASSPARTEPRDPGREVRDPATEL